LSVTAWTAKFNSGNASEWSQGGSGNVSYVTSSPTPYEGAYCGKSVCEAGSGTDFARWVKDDISVVAGDDIFWGYAIYIAPGFYALSRSSSTRLTTMDNFNVTESEDRVGLWIFSSANGHLHVNRHKEGTEDTSILDLGVAATVLPEGQWNYVEQRFKLSSTAGQAVTTVWINNTQVGHNTSSANLNSGFESPFGRFRGGIADISWTRSSDVTMYFDDFYIGTARRGSPFPGPVDSNVDARLKAVEAKVAALENKVVSLEAKAARDDKKLEEIETSAVTLGSRLRAL
jgi:hypothetical protein